MDYLISVRILKISSWVVKHVKIEDVLQPVGSFEDPRVLEQSESFDLSHLVFRVKLFDGEQFSAR